MEGKREEGRARIAAPMNTHTYPWWKHNIDHNHSKKSMLTMLPKKCAAALGEQLELCV